MSTVSSWFLAPAMLWVILAVAVGVSIKRPFPASIGRTASHLRRFGLIAVGAQATHFCEELLGGFHEVFPALLGLPPFTRVTFVVFNVSWLLIWLISVPAAASGLRFAEWPLWFLAIAGFFFLRFLLSLTKEVPATG